MARRSNGASAVHVRRDSARADARRIGNAWVELRRGAATSALRAYLFGREAPLEQGQMDALDLLTRRDSRPMKELAARLRVDPSTATRAMQRLENDGLVERFPSPEDGRVVLVRLTAEGRRRHDEVAGRRATAMARILGEFEPDERATLADLLDKFVRSLDQVMHELAADDDTNTTTASTTTASSTSTSGRVPSDA